MMFAMQWKGCATSQEQVNGFKGTGYDSDYYLLLPGNDDHMLSSVGTTM